ncbi:MAG: ABC transporter substrate-binding protein, partial [Candidatus Bathyarchaeota archaeon]|nr:ABC transporter substrate-binding protein [Candidatus Bathyarchaeota archaeon]
MISAGYSTSAEAGESVTFSASGSIDPDGTIEKFTWYFGDGMTGEGEEATHSYELPGYYIIYVEAEDDQGAKANTITTPIFLKVERPEIEELALDLPPVAIIGSSESVVEVGSEVAVDGASSYHYYERREEIQTTTANVDYWAWEMGDGTTYEGVTATHAYNEPGSYFVTLKVRDNVVGKEDTVGRTVIVTEEAVSYIGIIKNPDRIVMAMGAPSRVEPMEIAEGNVGRWVDLALTDTLFKFLPGGTEPTTEGGLAESYNVSADGRMYTFNLRKGVKFWDGTELKAEDVVYTYRRSLKLSVGRSWGALLVKAILGIDFGEPISDSVLEEHIYATDDYTVVFELPEPYGPFLFSVAYPGRGIIQKKAAIDAGSWFMGDTRDWVQVKDPIMDSVEGVITGVGYIASGPFKVVEWSKNERILLERNEDYWVGPAPTERFLSLNIPEWSTKYLMLRQGDLDMVSPAAPSEAEQLIALPTEIQVDVTPIKFEGFIEVLYFGFNFDETKAPADNQV